MGEWDALTVFGIIVFIGFVLCSLLIGCGLLIYYTSTNHRALGESLMRLGALVALSSMVVLVAGRVLLTAGSEDGTRLLVLIGVVVVLDLAWFAFRRRKRR